jgi:hypothetical protein
MVQIILIFLTISEIRWDMIFILIWYPSRTAYFNIPIHPSNRPSIHDGFKIPPCNCLTIFSLQDLKLLTLDKNCHKVIINTSKILQKEYKINTFFTVIDFIAFLWWAIKMNIQLLSNFVGRGYNWTQSLNPFSSPMLIAT